MWAGPAAAQEPAWVRDLAREIERQVERRAEKIAEVVEERAERIAEVVEDLAEQHLDAIVLAVEVQVDRQRQRQAGDAARRAAQAARDAERRRRDDARRGPEYTDQLSKTLRLGRNGTFDLQNVGGTIVVTGGGGNDVRIEATKRVRNPNESQARAMLQNIQVQMFERNGDVEVRTDYPRRNWSGGVDYTVSLPREANVVLRSVSGDIRVTSLNGELRAESMSGNVVTSAVRRIRLAKSVSGNVEIADSEGDEVAAAALSGDIIARNLKVRTVDLQSTSGNVRMIDVDSDRAIVRSVTGDIDFTGRVSRNGRYEFQSHSGDVRVTPTGPQGFSVEASTFSGDIRSAYPLTLQGELTRGFSPRGLNRRIRGSFGDGGATLSLQSFSGDIVIVKR